MCEPGYCTDTVTLNTELHDRARAHADTSDKLQLSNTRVGQRMRDRSATTYPLTTLSAEVRARRRTLERLNFPKIIQGARD